MAGLPTRLRKVDYSDSLEAKPKANAGTPTIVIGPIVGIAAIPVIGSVVAIRPIIGPVVRAITVTVPPMPIADFLHTDTRLSKRENTRLRLGWTSRNKRKRNYAG
jgi:hypothetical protein